MGPSFHPSIRVQLTNMEYDLGFRTKWGSFFKKHISKAQHMIFAEKNPHGQCYRPEEKARSTVMAFAILTF